MIKTIKIHHTAIICSNYQKSKHFYVNILGLQVLNEVYRKERDSFKLDLGIANNYVLELFSFPNAPERPSRPEACGLRHLAFAVSNIELEKANLEKAGIEVEPIRIDEYTGKKYTFFADPDALPLELYED